MNRILLETSSPVGYPCFSRGNWILGGKLIRKSVLLLLALGMLFVFPQAAGAAQTSATTETYDIPATMDWRKGNQSSVACYAFGLATWPEQKNAISWQVTYKWNGDPRSKTTSPPFDDERLNTAQFGNATPPAGSHWIVISEGYKAGLPGFPTPDCSDSLAFQQGAIGDVKVTVTVEAEEKDKCRAITDRDRRLERRVHNAREGKKRAKKRLRAAKKRLSKAEQLLSDYEKYDRPRKVARQQRYVDSLIGIVAERRTQSDRAAGSWAGARAALGVVLQNSDQIELMASERRSKGLLRSKANADSKREIRTINKKLKTEKKKQKKLKKSVSEACSANF